MTEIAVPRQALAAAARSLAHAGRWQDATALLDAVAPGDPVLALTSAQVAIESDWFAGTSNATQRLTTATRVAAGLDDAGRWDLAFVELRNAYRTLLITARSTHTPTPDRDIQRRAAELGATAPDAVRRGWAEMYQGLIADNLLDERDTAPAHYSAALDAGSADPLLAREALRHLGDHDREHGRHPLARQRWRRATELGAAAGNVPGTLSQQLLLAVSARDAGDEAGAVALAAEIVRWATALGAASLADQAAGFIAGSDPTVPPPAAAAPASSSAMEVRAAPVPPAAIAVPAGEPGPGAVVSFMTAPLQTIPRQ